MLNKNKLLLTSPFYFLYYLKFDVNFIQSNLTTQLRSWQFFVKDLALLLSKQDFTIDSNQIIMSIRQKVIGHIVISMQCTSI